MANELQHSSIPDEYLHEAKHALTANENTFLRALGNGATEFVELTLSSFTPAVVVRDDTTLSNEFPFQLKLGKQYVIMLVLDGDYINDTIDLRGMTALPTGTKTLKSVGGNVTWHNGLLTAKSTWNFFRVMEIQ